MNGLIKGLISGYSDAKAPKRKEWKYQELEEYPMLFSSKYLNECYEEATKKQEFESILDHIYRFGEVTHNVPSYQKIEQKIIDKYWRS